MMGAMHMYTYNTRNFHPSPGHRQRGAILVTSMLLLVVLTVLGVAMMRMTNMQERMAGNTRDLGLALQGAEAALRDAEDRLSPVRQVSRPTATNAANCVFCQRTALPIAIHDVAQYNWSNAQEYGTAGSQDITGLAADPRYTIAEMGFVPDDRLEGQDPPTGRDFYQITARSTGASGQANVVLQTTFPRRF
jgi:type IV pilus assembly protein PilX